MNARDVPELPADIRSLFEEEKVLVPLPDAARARVALRLAEAPSLPSWSSRALRLARKTGWVTVVFLAGAGAGAVFEHHRDEAREARATASVEPPVALASAPSDPGPTPAGHPDTSPEPATPVETPATPTTTAHAAPKAVKGPPSPGPSSLAEERAELETARVAMTRGRWEEAGAALDRHAALFPKGQLKEERESLRVVLLAEEGHASEARAAAARFARIYPTSFLLPVVRGAADSVTDASDAGQSHR